MYIVNGIAYAGEKKQLLKIVGVRPMGEHILWVRFNDDTAKYFDFKPLLDEAVFAPLRDPEVFKAVYIDYGVPTWNDGGIDIAPEYLYDNGVSEKEELYAG